MWGIRTGTIAKRHRHRLMPTLWKSTGKRCLKSADAFRIMFVFVSTHEKFTWVPMLSRCPARAPADPRQREPFGTQPGDDPARALSPGTAAGAHGAARRAQPEPAAELRHAGPHADGPAAHRWVGAAQALSPSLFGCGQPRIT